MKKILSLFLLLVICRVCLASEQPNIGVAPPEKPAFDGRSLLPVLTGKSEQVHEKLFWNSGMPKGEWAVRQGDWKAHGFKKKYQLYNLASDPSEKKDVSAAHPERAAKLAKMHDAWLVEMQASAKELGIAPDQEKRRRK